MRHFVQLRYKLKKFVLYAIVLYVLFKVLVFFVKYKRFKKNIKFKLLTDFRPVFGLRAAASKENLNVSSIKQGHVMAPTYPFGPHSGSY